MSAPDYNDPSSKLRLRLRRPGKLWRTYTLGFLLVWRGMIVFMALLLVPITYYEFSSRGFEWAIVGRFAFFLIGLAAFFLFGTWMVRFVKAITKLS